MTTQNIVPIQKVTKFTGQGSATSFEQAVGSNFNTLRFSAHEHLFMQGDSHKGVFRISSGTVILYKLMADGRRQIQDFSSAGDFLALTFADRHDLSAEALTDVQAQFIPRTTFDRALQDEPAFRRNVFTLIGEMLHASHEQALLLGRKSAMERTATFLIFLESRFAQPDSVYADIKMSRCDIADYLGLTLETVSRMMNRLKKLGIIDLPQPNQFRVLNRQRLLACAGETDEMLPYGEVQRANDMG